MKRMLSGWWDQVCMRDGWSDKIGKWQWVALQMIIPMLILLPIGFAFVSFSEGLTYRDFFAPLFIMMPLMVLFQSGGWNRDHRRSEGNRDDN